MRQITGANVGKEWKEENKANENQNKHEDSLNSAGTWQETTAAQTFPTLWLEQ